MKQLVEPEFSPPECLRDSQQGDKVRAEGIRVPLGETFRQVGDRPTIMIDGERRESGSVGISEL